jgi:hypothetical protein
MGRPIGNCRSRETITTVRIGHSVFESRTFQVFDSYTFSKRYNMTTARQQKSSSLANPGRCCPPTSNPIIRFRLTDNYLAFIDCEFGLAHGTVINRSKGATTPEIDSDVILCDMDGCFLNGPPNLLARREGWAQQLEGEDICQPRDYDTGREVWCIFAMCASDFSC